MFDRAVAGRTSSGSSTDQTKLEPNSTFAAQQLSAANPRLLLIEGDDEVAAALTPILKNESYAVFRARDAQEGLEQLRAGLSPDLILLDLMTPRMDGWEFRVEQRREPMLASIPMIAMSADDSAKARAIDASAFLKKPVEERGLIEALRTTREELEQQRNAEHAVQQERLSSLGVIAAGIAHEVNNPLAAVIGNLELATRRCTQLLSRLDRPEAALLSDVVQLVAQAQAGNERIAEVVRNVATFARPDSEEVVALDVQSVLESSLRLVANEIRHHALLERHYEPVPTVLGNAAKLGHVFLNLLIQAIHAIGDQPHSGVIRLATAVQGDRVVVSVSGSGARPRDDGLFDSSFPPRARPQALGLALSQRAIMAMGGTIRIDSDALHGNAFQVALPAHLPAAAAANTTTRGVESSDGRVRLLVIDDDEMMCEMLTATLADTFDVTVCIDSRLGLQRLLQEPFDVVLCDLMMPDLSGMEFYREVMLKEPALAERIVFMTGGTFTESAQLFLDNVAPHHINKPFKVVELIETLEAIAALVAPAKNRFHN